MSSAAPSRRPPLIHARRMRAADLDTIERIERAAYEFPWTRGNFADSIRAGYDCWLFDNGTIADPPLGYALLMWSPDEAHLLNLTVATEYQGRGFGRAALLWLLENVAARGAHRLLLEVRPSNPVAISLYDDCGFVRIGLRRGYYPAWAGQREDAIVMERRFR